jgi:UDP-4-amino-4,6-dideoxy-N-acetyl-beta-L-altrosamine transaminase
MIPYGRQYIDNEDISEVIKVLKSDYITQGPKVKEFEEKLAYRCGCRYAVVFNSGTSALHAAYFAIGLGKGDEFITTPITFVATANAGIYLGARPIFVDVERDTGNIDVSKIEEKITERTKLIVPVHYSGHPADMERIYELARTYNLNVIEDACHALGAGYKNEKVGCCRYSDMTVLSFHPVKHITTGEGGAVLTNDQGYYEKLLLFRTHGITKRNFLRRPDGEWYYEMQFLGYNYRITDIQAALGISQLRKLNRFVERRRYIARIYNRAFDGNPYFDIPVEKSYAYHSYHLYPIRLKDGYKDRKELIFSNMRRSGLGVQVHYIPVYFQPYYRKLGLNSSACPVAEDFYQREISIPIYPAMSDRDVNYVIEKVIESFEQIKDLRKDGSSYTWNSSIWYGLRDK